MPTPPPDPQVVAVTLLRRVEGTTPDVGDDLTQAILDTALLAIESALAGLACADRPDDGSRA